MPNASLELEQHPLAQNDMPSEALDQVENPATELFSYGFSRRHKVLLRGDNGQRELCCVPPVNFAVLAEVQRSLGAMPTIITMDDSEFDSALAIAYEQQRGVAAEAADSLEGMDLASLAEALPETSDLLEQEDDAPIIRLINALLQEAIREDDRKSTRLNSSHVAISYAVFCLKKKKAVTFEV